MAGATSAPFAFPFISAAFIIMRWLPDLIKVWANRGNIDAQPLSSKTQDRLQQEVPKPITSIANEVIWGLFIRISQQGSGEG